MKAKKRKQFFLLFAFFIPLLIGRTGFSNSITLEDATRMALASNEQILDSQASLETAQLNLQRAEKLFGSPQINLNLEPWQGAYDTGAGNFQSSAQVALTGTMKFSQGTDIGLSYQGGYDYEKGGYDDFYSLQLHQSLFQDYSLTPSALELYNARITTERAYLTLENIQKGIILSVVSDFYQLREVGNSLSLSKERMALSQEKLAETSEKKDFGLAGELDMLKAKIELAEYTQQLNQLENQLALTKDQFFHSIGAEKDTPLVFSPIKEEELRQKVQGLLTREINREIVLSQSELKQAQWTIDEKRLQLSKKEEELSPDFSLSLNYTSERSTSGGVVPAQSEAKIGVTYSLFDGGRAKLSMQAAEVSLKKAERDFENLKETVRFNLLAKRNSLKEALSQFNLWKLKKDEIKLRGELAQEQFSLGTISSQALKEFQLQEIQLENSYQSVLYNLLTSYFSYQLSLGMNIDFDEVIGK